MDAVHFGRWISEQRRKHGWSSQRALAEAAQRNPLLSDCRISEDFLARLEAGHLAHPFRGNVRRQILALAWLLCKTSRDIQTLLHAAEMTNLSQEEHEGLRQLRAYLTHRAPAVLLLPSRPAHLFGRERELHELVHSLSTLNTGICAISGMVGIGKSSLAYEAVHMLASDERLQAFPDGIATFSCAGRYGIAGLIALLDEICAVFAHPSASPRTKRQVMHDRTSLDRHSLQPMRVEAELASTIDRTRMVLADKSVLILLDDLEMQFPLRQALDALSGYYHGRGASSSGQARRVILTTSQHIPARAYVAYHAHLTPLQPEAAIEFFVSLIGESSASLPYEKYMCVEQICAAVGYLPLAIEVAANAVIAKGIPLTLLAPSTIEQPLNSLLDGDYILRSTLERTFRGFELEMQQHFALLSTLGTHSFKLESAASLYKSARRALYTLATMAAEHSANRSLLEVETARRQDIYATARYLSRHTMDGKGKIAYNIPAENTADVSFTQLASTAADLGQFVSHSLIELVPDELPTQAVQSSQYIQACYRLHPLLHAYASSLLEQLEPQFVHSVQSDVEAFTGHSST